MLSNIREEDEIEEEEEEEENMLQVQNKSDEDTQEAGEHKDGSRKVGDAKALRPNTGQVNSHKGRGKTLRSR